MRILSAVSKESKLFNLIKKTFSTLGQIDISIIVSNQYVTVTLVHPTTINLETLFNLYKVLYSKGIFANYNPKSMVFTLSLHKYKDIDNIDFYELYRTQFD